MEHLKGAGTKTCLKQCHFNIGKAENKIKASNLGSGTPPCLQTVHNQYAN